MSKKKLKKKLKWSIIFVLTSCILLGSLTIFISNKYFDENNPFAVMKGIIQIQLSETSVVQINQQEHRFITPNQTFEGDPYGIVKQFMKEDGWTFEQLDNGVLTFSQGSQMTFVEARPFTADYYIFDINNDSDIIS